MFRKGGAADIEKAKEDMGFELAEEFASSGKEVLANEFENAVGRYLAVCAKDKNYKKKTFGIVSMKENELSYKLAQDAWVLAEGLNIRFELNSALEPFGAAAKTAYFNFEQKADEYWQECETDSK